MTRQGYYYRLDETGENPVECSDISEWAEWFSGRDRRVAWDEIDGVRISTVFLGINHRFFGEGPPILWETMVFENPGNWTESYCERYSSAAEARAGHQRAVGMVTTRNL